MSNTYLRMFHRQNKKETKPVPEFSINIICIVDKSTSLILYYLVLIKYVVTLLDIINLYVTIYVL